MRGCKAFLLRLFEFHVIVEHAGQNVVCTHLVVGRSVFIIMPHRLTHHGVVVQAVESLYQIVVFQHDIIHAVVVAQFVGLGTDFVEQFGDGVGVHRYTFEQGVSALKFLARVGSLAAVEVRHGQCEKQNVYAD